MVSMSPHSGDNYSPNTPLPLNVLYFTVLLLVVFGEFINSSMSKVWYSKHPYLLHGCSNWAVIAWLFKRPRWLNWWLNSNEVGLKWAHHALLKQFYSIQRTLNGTFNIKQFKTWVDRWKFVSDKTTITNSAWLTVSISKYKLTIGQCQRCDKGYLCML